MDVFTFFFFDENIWTAFNGEKMLEGALEESKVYRNLEWKDQDRVDKYANSGKRQARCSGCHLSFESLRIIPNKKKKVIVRKS